MRPLLLWNNAYFFGGIADFLLIVTLIIVALVVLAHWPSKDEQSTVKSAADPIPTKVSGCTTFLVAAAGFVFVLFLLAKLLAS
jgi:hypothetical protein